MPAWVIQIIAMGVTLSVQVAAIAFFLGKMKAYQEGNAKLVSVIQGFADERLKTVNAKVDHLDTFTRDAAQTFSGFDARLSELQSNTKELPAFRERFAAFEAKTVAHAERMEAESTRTHMAVESLQRQVGSLAIHGGGRLVELPATQRGGQ